MYNVRQIHWYGQNQLLIFFVVKKIFKNDFINVTLFKKDDNFGSTRKIFYHKKIINDISKNKYFFKVRWD